MSTLTGPNLPKPGQRLWVADPRTPHVYEGTVAAVTSGPVGVLVYLRGVEHPVRMAELSRTEREANARVTVWLEANAREGLSKLERWRRYLATNTLPSRSEIENLAP